MEYAFKSDIGRHREINEDYLYAGSFGDYYVFVIADGMGGHLAGEVASKLAVESIIAFIEDKSHMLEDTVRIISESIRYANEEIYRLSKSPDYNNMGTTCELVIIKDETAFIGHVGDSRVYRLRGENLEQVTRDHSLINDLLDSGSISEYEANKMPQKNIITRALDGQGPLNIDIHELDLAKGDFILICTDGVSGAINDQQIKAIIRGNADLELAVDSLIDASNDAGGLDNSSVILVEKR